MSTIRIRISSQTAFKTAELVSNSILLATNAYLAGAGIHNQFRNRKRERIAENLQMAAEIASTMAGLAQVVTSSLDKHHASDT